MVWHNPIPYKHIVANNNKEILEVKSYRMKKLKKNTNAKLMDSDLLAKKWKKLGKYVV